MNNIDRLFRSIVGATSDFHNIVTVLLDACKAAEKKLQNRDGSCPELDILKKAISLVEDKAYKI